MFRLVRLVLLGGVRRTILFLLLVILVTEAILQFSDYRDHARERGDQEVRRNVELARSMGSTIDAYVDELLHQGLILGIALNFSPTVAHANYLLAVSVAADPKLRDLSWITPQCRVVASSESQTIGRDSGYRQYCDAIVAGREWVISDLIRQGADERPAIAVLRASRDQSGRLIGMVGATIDPQNLGRALGLELSGRSEFTVIDTLGRAVYRYPEMDMSWEGRDLLGSDGTLSRALAGEEVTGTTTGSDEQRRLFGSVPVPTVGWVVSVSRPEEEVMMPLVEAGSRQMGLSIALMIASLLVAVAISRNITLPLHRLGQGAIALGRGDRRHRVRVEGPHELKAVAESFNLMAAEIEARETVLERYRLLSKHARDVLLFLRPDGSIMEANDAAVQVHGYTRDELLAMNFAVLAAVPDPSSVIDMIARVGPDGVLFEAAGCRKDGSTFPADISAQSAKIGGERVILAIVRDITRRKKVEIALRESESLYRTLAESDPDIVFVFDRDRRISYLNGLAANLIQAQPLEAIGKKWDELLPALVRDREGSNISKVFEQAAPIYYEHNIEAAGGKMCLGTWLAPVKDESGAVTAVMSVSRDITQHKSVETALLRSEEKYRSLVQHMPDAAWTADRDGNASYVSPNILDVEGFTEQEIYDGGGAGWMSRIHPDDVARVQNAFQMLFDGAGPYDVEYRLRKKNGDWVWLHDRAVATYERDGMLYADGIVSDISERRQAQDEREKLLEAVQDKASELDAVISSIADAVVIYNTDLEIVRLNPAAMEIFDYSPEEQRLPYEERLALARAETPDGRPLPPGDLPALLALEGESVQGMLIVIRGRPDARTVWTCASAAPIYGAGGQVLGVVSVFTDITALHELEIQREGFISLISHDLRNPLTVIQGYAQALVRRFAKREDLQPEQSSAANVLTAARQMNTMIQDLVDSVRLESGQMQLQTQAVRLAAFVDELLARNGPLIDSRRLRTDFPAGLPPVAADPDRLERILLNLLTNGLKYSGPHEYVYVRAVAADGDAVISVEDHGVGIESEDLPHIFERFYRPGTGRKAGGLGLGLYICRMLVEAHGGHIWAESQVGHGTKFHFTLHLA